MNLRVGTVGTLIKWIIKHCARTLVSSSMHVCVEVGKKRGVIVDRLEVEWCRQINPLWMQSGSLAEEDSLTALKL